MENYDSSPHKRDNTAIPNWIGPRKVFFSKMQLTMYFFPIY